MIVKIDLNISECPEIDPVLGQFFSRFKMKAIDHHNLSIGDMSGLIVFAQKACEQQHLFPNHPGIVEQLFSLDRNLKKVAAPYLKHAKDKHKNVLFIDSLVIDDECRGMGYGREMLARLSDLEAITPIAVLRASPFLIELEDFPKSEHRSIKRGIHDFYRKIGFSYLENDVFIGHVKRLALNPPRMAHLAS